MNTGASVMRIVHSRLVTSGSIPLETHFSLVSASAPLILEYRLTDMHAAPSSQTHSCMILGTDCVYFRVH